MKVKNNLAHRPAAVRTGAKEGDKLVKIQPGQTVDVPGFDPKDEFHAGLIDRGDISVGQAAGSATKNSDQKQAQLQADLDAAQREVQEAETAYTTAAGAANAEGATAEQKTAKKNAGDRVRTARANLAKAEDAFAKGV